MSKKKMPGMWFGDVEAQKEQIKMSMSQLKELNTFCRILQKEEIQSNLNPFFGHDSLNPIKSVPILLPPGDNFLGQYWVDSITGLLMTIELSTTQEQGLELLERLQKLIGLLLDETKTFVSKL